jgi:hypothetical protein
VAYGGAIFLHSRIPHAKAILGALALIEEEEEEIALSYSQSTTDQRNL